jgi:RNA polymerase primary sigma factor
MSTLGEGPGESRSPVPVGGESHPPALESPSQPAGDDWIESHRRRIFWIAREFRHFGVPMEDLLAEGTVGLLEAASRYDPTRGVKFASYAVWWIRKRICETAISQTALIRIPRYRLRHLYQVREAEREIRATCGRPPSSEEIAELSGLPGDEVRFLLGLSKREIPLGALVSAESSLSLEETLAHESLDAPDDTLLREDRLALLGRVLARLPRREAEILSMRFGLGGRPPRTLAEVGRRLGVSRERVRQVENRALEHLRQLLIDDPGHGRRWARSPRLASSA